jgi:NitT/TauT family transport system ATP-binding protein
MSLLSLQQVRFAFPGWPPTVDGVDLEVERGAFHCLVGRSGCGKTTLLKLAAGLLVPDSGRVVFRGRARDALGPDIGFVFQTPNLLEWHRVVDNVLLPVSLHHRPTAEERRRALQLLEQLGLAAHAQKYPRQLSGGQQSRVALARALILQPSLLLLDEPFAALDAITREELQRDLLQMSRSRATSVLFVTHDIAEAVYLANRVDVVEAGRIAQEITVTLPAHGAATRTSAAFADYCAQVRAALHLESAEEVAQ